MKILKSKKLLYTLITLLILTTIVFLWSNNELNKVLGKSTKAIDIASIVKPTEIIQIKNVPLHIK